jgi:2'-5' RNA ligase
MRLFVGLPIPDDVADRAAALIEHLRPFAKLQWSPRENLHITTKFIGSWPEARLDGMHSALGAIQAEAFDVSLGGPGWFPNPHAPRVFWAGVQAGVALSELARLTDEATSRLGVEPEKRGYTPHMTLARVKPGVDIRALRGAVADLKPEPLGAWRATEFFLYLSETKPAGSVYTRLGGFDLH